MTERLQAKCLLALRIIYGVGVAPASYGITHGISGSSSISLSSDRRLRNQLLVERND